MKKPLSRLPLKIAVSVLITLLLLIILELLISIFLPSVTPPSRVFFTPFASPENKDAHVREALVSNYYLEDPELFWKLNPGKANGEITEEGFRARRLYGENRESVYRIVALGDSCTFGVGADDMDSSYPALLESVLLAGSDRGNVEVINAGVPGYASLQGLRYLKKILPRYKPDLVIVQFLHNDGVTWLNRPDREVVVPGERARKIQQFVRRSRLYELMRRGILRLKRYRAGGSPRDGGLPYRVSPDDYRKNLVAMAGLAERSGAAVLFVVPPALPPYRFRPDFTDYREATIAAARETGTPLLDLTETFDKIENVRALFRSPESEDFAHLNSRGYAIKAEKVADRVGELITRKNP